LEVVYSFSLELAAMANCWLDGTGQGKPCVVSYFEIRDWLFSPQTFFFFPLQRQDFSFTTQPSYRHFERFAIMVGIPLFFMCASITSLH
jgi:hypothetical protein